MESTFLLSCRQIQYVSLIKRNSLKGVSLEINNNIQSSCPVTYVEASAFAFSVLMFVFNLNIFCKLGKVY